VPYASRRVRRSESVAAVRGGTRPDCESFCRHPMGDGGPGPGRAGGCASWRLDRRVDVRFPARRACAASADAVLQVHARGRRSRRRLSRVVAGAGAV